MATKKARATVLENDRLDILCNLLNGGKLTENEFKSFACSRNDVLSIRTNLLKRVPTFQKAIKVGGLNKHYDILIVTTDNKNIKVEVKYSDKKKTPLSVLTYEPWQDGVQLLQFQMKALIGAFLGDCSTPMIEEWYVKIVLPFMQQNSELFTSCMLGEFKTNSVSRNEFLDLIRTGAS